MTEKKIKLVAIAKDEAAYIPEWVFHHLYFGFDAIEVYVNFTSDKSYDVLNKIQEHYPVQYRNAEYLTSADYNPQFDYLLAPEYIKKNTFQSRAYAELLSRAKADGYSHVMFLDLDEYWTPVDFTKHIKDVLDELGDPDDVPFKWKNKVGETEPFGRPFKSQIRYLESKVPKTVVKTDVDAKLMNSHRCSITRSNGRKPVRIGQVTNAFILHRFQRSELEYLSLLGRGDPKFAGKFGLKFNRGGYIGVEKSVDLSFDAQMIDGYDQAYRTFVEKTAIADLLNDGQAFVSERANQVVEYIQDTIKVNKIARKVIRGLALENEIYSALDESRGLKASEIETIKKIALKLESNDLGSAYELMKIAYAFKPDGTTIAKKVRQYALKLGNDG